MRGGKAIVRVEEHEVPALIGKGGKTVQMLERKLGIRLDIKALEGKPRAQRDDERFQGGWDGGRPAPVPGGSGGRGAAGVPRVRVKRASTNIFLLVEGVKGGEVYRVEAEGAIIGEATASNQGRIRFKLDTPEGMALDVADKKGLAITVLPA